MVRDCFLCLGYPLTFVCAEENLIVKKMGLFAVSLRRYNGLQDWVYQFVIYRPYSHVSMAQKPITSTVNCSTSSCESYRCQMSSAYLTRLFASINARRSDVSLVCTSRPTWELTCHPQKTAELCSLSIDWRTPLEKLDELEQCLNGWLAKEKNSWFQPSTGVALQHIKNMRWLEITIGIPHNT